jgi:hypothetical protein
VQAPAGSIGVNGEIVTPPPAQPPKSVDQCQLNPGLPGCQLVLPPSEAQPSNPVQVAVNQSIQLINNSSSSEPGQASVASSPDEGTDKQAKEKSGKLAQDKSTGAKKNDPAAKMYCN